MNNPWVVIGIITVVLFGGAIALSGGQSAAPVDESIETIAHVKGNPDAAVTLTEYSDFQCPACASFQPVLSSVLEQFDGDIKLEFKHFPLLSIHPHAQAAGVAAEAAGQQGKFFEYHDILFARQQEWSSAGSPTSYFVQYAEELQLDLELFRGHLKSKVLRDQVRAGFNEARELELTGTPTFFLNGQRMEFQSIEEFVTQIAFAVDPVEAASSTGMTAPAGGSNVRFGI